MPQAFFNSRWLSKVLLVVLTGASGWNTCALKAPERPLLVRTALERNETIYYFGLGSNMSRKKLENRGVNGTKIDVLSMHPAVVPDHRLAFNLRGFPPLEPGMGSLEPISGSSRPLLMYDQDECHGALVCLTSENYEKVMRSEGINGKKDQSYEEVVVDAYPYEGDPVKAIALRARPHARLNFDPCPSARYMSILKEGAKELGLKPCYQEFLERHPVEKVANHMRYLALYNILSSVVARRLKLSFLRRIQNWLLFRVYVPSNAPKILKGLSDSASAVILLPGAASGFLIYHIAALSGHPPPMMARMKAILLPEGEGTNSTVT